jgi:hypothetical protein
MPSDTARTWYCAEQYEYEPAAYRARVDLQSETSSPHSRASNNLSKLKIRNVRFWGFLNTRTGYPKSTVFGQGSIAEELNHYTLKVHRLRIRRQAAD